MLSFEKLTMSEVRVFVGKVDKLLKAGYLFRNNI